MKKVVTSLPFKLLLGVVIGIVAGQFFGTALMNVVVTVKFVLGEFINFCVPLIIIGFIAPSITRLGRNASRMLGVAIFCAYLSSVLAAFMSMGAGYGLIPHLSIVSEVEGLKELPEVVFQLEIPQIMSVMSALVFSVLIGLAATWTKAVTVTNILEEFQKIVLTVMVGHFIWMTVLYTVAGIYSKSNPLEVIKNYGPAYITAVGTMSSAATLAVALRCAKKSKPLREDMVDFGIPLFANIHLCGSVLTEVFFVMTVSLILYGQLPSVGMMILFCLLLGIFAIGAPGVPGGTVMASLGLITGVLGFDSTGTALMLTIFALQDSFGTACNITGDGALTMILTGYANRHKIEKQDLKIEL